MCAAVTSCAGEANAEESVGVEGSVDEAPVDAVETRLFTFFDFFALRRVLTERRRFGILAQRVGTKRVAMRNVCITGIENVYHASILQRTLCS